GRWLAPMPAAPPGLVGLHDAPHRAAARARAPPPPAEKNPLAAAGWPGTHPHAPPLPIRAAPERAPLAVVLAGARGAVPVAIDPDDNGHRLAAEQGVEALERVDLPTERVQPGSLRDGHVERELVVGEAPGDRSSEQVELLRVHAPLAARTRLRRCAALLLLLGTALWLLPGHDASVSR